MDVLIDIRTPGGVMPSKRIQGGFWTSRWVEGTGNNNSCSPTRIELGGGKLKGENLHWDQLHEPAKAPVLWRTGGFRRMDEFLCPKQSAKRPAKQGHY